MVDITSLEQYFDIILEGKFGYDQNHPLGDDEKRFEFYKQITRGFRRIGGNLGEVIEALKKTYPDYIDMVEQLATSFKELASISDEDLDYYLRTLAVDRLVYKREKMSDITDEMLGYMVEGLMELFVEEGEELVKETKKRLLIIKNTKRKSRFWKKKYEDELKERVTDTLEEYEVVEECLKEAKNGVIAKDKKMIRILRDIKAGLKQSLIHEAISKTSEGYRDPAKILKASKKKDETEQRKR